MPGEHRSAEHLEYVLRLADNALVLGQRLAEWCGHGPALEEDIAATNVALPTFRTHPLNRSQTFLASRPRLKILVNTSADTAPAANSLVSWTCK